MKFRSKILSKLLKYLLFLYLISFSGIWAQEQIKKKFTLGISTEIFEDVNINDVKVTLKIWGNLLISELKNVDDLDIMVYENVESIIKDSKQNKIDIMYISSLMYAKYENEINLTPVVTTKSNEKDFYKLNLLTNKSNPVSNFSELKNSVILVQGGKYKNVSGLWLDVLALQNGVKDQSSFFKKIEFVEKPMQAVLPTFMGKADYCIVNSVLLEAISELNPQVTKSLKSVFISPDLSNDLICVSKLLTEDEVKLVSNIALNFNSMPKNEQLFKIFKTYGAGKFKKSDLDGIKS